MTIDEAIEHCLAVANSLTYEGKCEKCAKDHEQLAQWLEELKERREQNDFLAI